MRLPTRKSELQKRQLQKDEPVYLTRGGIQKLESDITRIEKELPEVIEEVQRTREMGDLSENAAYQQAKHQMRRMQGRLMHLKERRKNVIEIEKQDSETVQLGSTVVLESDGEQKTFEIVGPLETNPAKGRVSHVSPLGSELIGKTVGDEISLPTGKAFIIISIH